MHYICHTCSGNRKFCPNIVLILIQISVLIIIIINTLTSIPWSVLWVQTSPVMSHLVCPTVTADSSTIQVFSVKSNNSMLYKCFVSLRTSYIFIWQSCSNQLNIFVACVWLWYLKCNMFLFVLVFCFTPSWPLGQRCPSICRKPVLIAELIAQEKCVKERLRKALLFVQEIMLHASLHNIGQQHLLEINNQNVWYFPSILNISLLGVCGFC